MNRWASVLVAGVMMASGPLVLGEGAGGPSAQERALALGPFALPGVGGAEVALADGGNGLAGLPFAAPAYLDGQLATIFRAQGDIELLDTGTRVALDHDDVPNPVLAGYYYRADPYEGYNGVLVKFNGQGEMAYRTGIHLKDLEVLYGVAVDEEGNAYGAGYSIAFDSPTKFLYKMLAVKVDGAGTVLWVKELRPDPVNIYNLALDVALDAQGNAVFAGYSTNSTPGFNYDADVAKLDPEGNVLWMHRVALPGTSELVLGVDVDAAGNIYLGGSSVGQSGWDALVVKLDPEGRVLARRAFDAGGSETVGGIAVDPQGNVFLAGTVEGTPAVTGRSAFLARLTPDLQPGWALALPGGTDTHGTDVAVDTLGNAVLGGTATAPGLSGAFVAKVTPVGAVLFTRLVDAGPFAGSAGFGVATTPEGLLLATGGTAVDPDGGTDLFATKGLGVGTLGMAGGALTTALNADAIVLAAV